MPSRSWPRAGLSRRRIRSACRSTRRRRSAPSPRRRPAAAVTWPPMPTRRRRSRWPWPTGSVHRTRQPAGRADRRLDGRTRCVPGADAGHLRRDGAAGRELGLAPVAQAKNREVLDAGRTAIRLAREAGVRIGFGTDLMGALDDEQLHGLRLQAEVEGPLALLRAATSVNAELLGRDDLGRIGPGAVADLLVLDGDPLQDPSVLWGGPNRRAVFQGGIRVAEHGARLVLLSRTATGRQGLRLQGDPGCGHDGLLLFSACAVSASRLIVARRRSHWAASSAIVLVAWSRRPLLPGRGLPGPVCGG